MRQDAMLAAVNECLAGIGQAPVDNIHDPDLDAAMALQVIERVSHDMQTRGWWFNKEENWCLTPDPFNGFMSPPENAISIIQNSDIRYHQLAIRNNRIYDVDNHTYDLRKVLGDDETILFSFVLHLPFEDTPPVFQFAVTATAKRIYAQNMEVDQARWQFQRFDEDRGVAALYREDGRNAKRNYIKDSPTIRQSGLNFSGMNSYRSNKPW